MNRVFIRKDREGYIDSVLVSQYVLSDGRRIVGFYRAFKDEKTVFFDMEILDSEKDSISRNASLVLNHIITNEKPDRIVYIGENEAIKARLLKQLFKEEEKALVREVEPYRYLIPNQAFDEEGFIVHQGLTENVRFGFLSSKRNGCGWIYAYNLLKLCGKEQTIQEVSTALSKGNLLGEVFGESIYRIFLYLRRNGLPVRITHAFKSVCLRNMAKSKCGILLYIHKRGSHFVTYRKTEDGRYHFYNAVYGDKYTVMSPEEFTKKYTISPISFLIWIPE